MNIHSSIKYLYPYLHILQKKNEYMLYIKNEDMNKVKNSITISSFILFFALFYIITINDQSKPLTITYSFAQSSSSSSFTTNSLKKETIPPYAVDQFGNKTTFPLYTLTNDKKIETGLSWNPPSIKTNEPITFLMDFFSNPQNEPLHLWPYNFIIIQNGKEIYRTSGMTQMGSSTESYIFNSPGKTFIKIQSAQDPNSFSQYGTIVYNNPNSSSINRLSNIQQNNANSSTIIELISTYLLNYGSFAFVIVIVIILVALAVYLKKTRVKEEECY